MSNCTNCHIISLTSSNIIQQRISTFLKLDIQRNESFAEMPGEHSLVYECVNLWVKIPSILTKINLTLLHYTKKQQNV